LLKAGKTEYLVEEINCVDNYDFQLTRPKTALYKKLQQINLPNPITYLLSIVNNKELFIYRTYKQETYAIIKCTSLYGLYKDWCIKYKFEAFTFSQFENKIIEDNKCGITKCNYRSKFKAFKIYKDIFETCMDKYNSLEDLEEIDDDFIDEEDYE
jgi:hypothetical protein